MAEGAQGAVAEFFRFCVAGPVRVTPFQVLASGPVLQHPDSVCLETGLEPVLHDPMPCWRICRRSTIFLAAETVPPTIAVASGATAGRPGHEFCSGVAHG